ncbi:MAG: class IV adenylate cyclase [Euryarchaeota archaeon]|nr:class IV adenylate cyclase [Euryarchaeota archaeon]
MIGPVYAMMLEIEIKSPIADPDEIRNKLVILGATHIKNVHQRDSYFSHPCRDFGITDEALRIRQQEGNETLYYKGPKIDLETKAREEIALPLTNGEVMRTILQRIGFIEVISIEKDRYIYQLNNVEVALDYIEDLGNFVELEIRDEDIEKGKNMIKEVMKSLGLEISERRSYLELLMERARDQVASQ